VIRRLPHLTTILPSAVSIAASPVPAFASARINMPALTHMVGRSSSGASTVNQLDQSLPTTRPASILRHCAMGMPDRGLTILAAGRSLLARSDAFMFSSLLFAKE
jgi:hypothetical protein